MGEMMRAACPCGFEKHMVPVGAGMLNFGTYYLLPAICLQCGAFDSADYLAHPEPLCEACGKPLYFYTEAEPKRQADRAAEPESVGNEAVDRWPVLATENCLCPACRKFTLAFEMAAQWD